MVEYIIEIGDRFKLRNSTIHYGADYAMLFVHSKLEKADHLLEGEIP